MADQIDDDEVPVEQLAQRCGTSTDGLDRVLRLLSAHGIFGRRSGSYVQTQVSQLLRSDHPMTMRPFIRMMGRPAIWTGFGALDHAIRTGAPGFAKVDENGLWSYLRSHPDDERIFGEAMMAKAKADIACILGAYDFLPFGTIADIGGGRGHLLRAILDTVPGVTGILFDLPGVIESLGTAPRRLRYHPGDFFVDPLPSAEAYVLMDVIHDWADGEASGILRAVRSAARPGATLLIIEAIIPDGEIDPRVHTLDVIMLAITGGRERSATELVSLLATAGFEAAKVVETGGPVRILEARAV